MDNEEFAFELRKLASQTEVIIQTVPEVKGLPLVLTASITDAALRMSDLLSLLAREVEMFAPHKVPLGPPATT